MKKIKLIMYFLIILLFLFMIMVLSPKIKKIYLQNTIFGYKSGICGSEIYPTKDENCPHHHVLLQKEYESEENFIIGNCRIRGPLIFYTCPIDQKKHVMKNAIQ